MRLFFVNFISVELDQTTAGTADGRPPLHVIVGGQPSAANTKKAPIPEGAGALALVVPPYLDSSPDK